MAKLAEARRLAERLLEQMRPHCERIMIAGSIRRGKPEVKDIELVAIPKIEWSEEPGDTLFEPVKQVSKNLLWRWALAQQQITWIKPGTSEIIVWEPKTDGKYWRGILPLGEERIKLDLFLLNAQNWGVLSTIRAGPAQFSEALVTFIKHKTKFRVGEGHLRNEQGEIIPCAEETDFFRNAGLEFVPVEKRSPDYPYAVLRLADSKAANS